MNTENEVQIKNRGTGAGGANTNAKGKTFEEETSNEHRLLENGFTKTKYTLEKDNISEKISYVSQGSLKKYMKEKYGKTLFRNPDEAYIIEYPDGRKPHLLILEKKAQNVAGSVDTKLLAGPLFREEYELSLDNEFRVQYAFCVSSFLQRYIESDKTKWVIFNKLMEKHEIPILFGDSPDYFSTLDAWISKYAKQ